MCSDRENGGWEEAMEARTGRIRFVAMTVLLVLAAALLFGETVRSGTDLGVRETEEYYLEKERELTAEIRELLRQKGFANSGVMVTRVVEEDGSRRYTVTVHHGRIDDMNDAEREELLGCIEVLSFADGNCSFTHRFLLDD